MRKDLFVCDVCEKGESTERNRHGRVPPGWTTIVRSTEAAVPKVQKVEHTLAFSAMPGTTDMVARIEVKRPTRFLSLRLEGDGMLRDLFIGTQRVGPFGVEPLRIADFVEWFNSREKSESAYGDLDFGIPAVMPGIHTNVIILGTDTPPKITIECEELSDLPMEIRHHGAGTAQVCGDCTRKLTIAVGNQEVRFSRPRPERMRPIIGEDIRGDGFGEVIVGDPLAALR